MNLITIAFDVDGTLLEPPASAKSRPVASERIRLLLVYLSSLKNTHIIVWSARGQAYATSVTHQLGLESYVDSYQSKNNNPVKPMIAFDDLDSPLGVFTLLV
jgi:hydroxymethylpyrimidine pyrophosphatase-like HAD family hydrolase